MAKLTGQNTSSAVMAQRREPPDSLDFFPTPPWATRALVWHVLSGLIGKPDGLYPLSAADPACGEGHMARPLAEFFDQVVASDIHPYRPWQVCYDFLDPGLLYMAPKPVDWVITNPPFNKAMDFAWRGQLIARHGVALLVRTAWLEGVGRYEMLYSRAQPTLIAQFSERVPMVRGRLDKKASTATAYCWVVWHKPSPPGLTRFVWIPPCRRDLEVAADYEMDGENSQSKGEL